jgi:hypothetical protein
VQHRRDRVYIVVRLNVAIRDSPPGFIGEVDTALKIGVCFDEEIVQRRSG